MKRHFLTMVTAGLIMCFGTAIAQTTVPDKEGKIQQRRENQQRRIGSGVANGTLSSKEATHLERNQTRLNHEIRNDRRSNGGTLTNSEKKQINRQQNRLSGQIYRAKHDGPKQ